MIKHESILSFQVEKREKQLRSRLPQEHSITNRIRLAESDLKIVLTEGTRMVELFYPDAVLVRMKYEGSSEKESSSLKVGANNPISQFWAGYNLEENDWLGLASSLLAEIFSAEFLTPLQDVDTAFSLKVSSILVNVISSCEVLIKFGSIFIIQVFN